MPNIDNYVSTNRADDAWARINDKSSSIKLVRKDTTLAAQTVRLELDNTTTEVTGAGGTIVSVQRGRVFGVRGHCSIANTDIKKGDRFSVDGVQYRVLSIINQTGEIQAAVEVTS